jgi:hypothetical protein
MKYFSLILISLVCSTALVAQKGKYPPISGVNGLLMVGKIDKPDDRYAVEVNLTKFIAQFGMKVLPSLNFSKVGASTETLKTDSLNALLHERGINGYMLVSVRGFDRKFKPRTNFPLLLEEALEEGHLYPIYQEEVSSVTFEFLYYENGQFIGYDMIRVTGVGNRGQVFEKLQKKIGKRLNKWTAPRK